MTVKELLAVCNHEHINFYICDEEIAEFKDRLSDFQLLVYGDLKVKSFTVLEGDVISELVITLDIETKIIRG